MKLLVFTDRLRHILYDATVTLFNHCTLAKPAVLIAICILFPALLIAQADENNPPPLVESCENTTFSLRLKGNTGEKVQLARVRSYSDGNYLVAGTVTLSNNTTAAMLTNMANDGNLLSHHRFKVDDNSSKLTDVRILPSGEIFTAGVINDGSNRVFMNRLNADFSVIWQLLLTTTDLPQHLTLGIFDTTSIAMAVQLPGAVEYAAYRLDGSNIFDHRIDLPNTTELVSFGSMNNSDLGIVTNETYLGKPGTRVTVVNKTTGEPGLSALQGNGSEGVKTFDAEMFYSRLHLTGLRNNPTKGFYPFRSLIYLPDNNQNGFDYQAATPLDFNVSGAKDPNGDAMAYFNPSNKKLLFFHHLNEYAPIFTFVRTYDMPEVSDVRSIARSYDGGYLIGLNSIAADVLFLLKTDSTGTAYGCGPVTGTMTFTQVFQSTNTLDARTSSSILLSGADAGNSNIPGDLTSSFDCRQTSCPPKPLEDTCTSTYFKTFRSGSFLDIPTSNMLFSNNRQIIPFIRQDRILGEGYIAAYGLKMFDEKGRLLKAVDLYQGSVKVGGTLIRVDNSHLAMLMGDQVSLMDDNMNILFTSRITTTADAFSLGLPLRSVHRDITGNLYLLYVGGSVFDPVKVAVHKLDATGNYLWSSAFIVDRNLSASAGIVTTPAGVVIIGEAPEGYTLLLNPDNGALLKSHRFTVPFIKGSLGITERLFAYHNGRIYYGGTNGDGHLTIGLLDSTGLPLKFRTLPATNIRQGSHFLDGFMYLGFSFYTPGNENILIKIDSTLTPVFSKAYTNVPFTSQRGLNVGKDGSIYTMGTLSYMNSDYRLTYLRKFDKYGESGDCPSRDVSVSFTNIPFSVSTIAVTPVTKTFTAVPGVLNFQTTKSQLHLADIFCSTKDLCTAVKLDDPGNICELNTDVVLNYTTNAGCTREPMWFYDSSAILMKSFASGKATVQFLKPGISRLIARLNLNCSFYDDTLQIAVAQKPLNMTLGNDTLVCDGNRLVLSPGSGFNSYLWQDGSTQSQYPVTEPGKYWVRIADQDNCISSDTISITAGKSPSAFLPLSDTICRYGKLVLIPVGKFSSYNWSDGTNSATTTVSQPGIYSLEVTDENGCRARESVTVIQKDCRNAVFIPTAFTPNRDGLNDVFRATVFGGVRDFLLVVYNRYGEIVFSTNDWSKSWDGSYKGRPADVGNFVWKCTYRVDGEESVMQKGSVILLR